jgi:hypothetical protein
VSKALRQRGPGTWGEENIMMILLGYFLIAVVAAVSASALIGLFLTNLLIGHFKNSDRLSRWISFGASGMKKECHTNHRHWRFECFSRHQTQARLAGVLIRRR